MNRYYIMVIELKIKQYVIIFTLIGSTKILFEFFL